MQNKILAISAPSGGGKSVATKYILSNFTKFELSISTTTRYKRDGEMEGIHYYFNTIENFRNKISNNEFIEYEQFFDNYYGTTLKEIQRIFDLGKFILFDIDVKGALSIKKHFPENSVLLFLEPPSIEVLRERLLSRNTETSEQIDLRIRRAEEEIFIAKKFDYIIINDDLRKLEQDIYKLVVDNFEVL